MNLDPYKPIGAFLENTIRPLLGEVRWLFEELEKKGIKVNESNVKSIIDYAVRAHIRNCICNAVQAVVVCLIICGTWLITLNFQ